MIKWNIKGGVLVDLKVYWALLTLNREKKIDVNLP